jgi:predicted lipid-binding transport protein (Tim44 family)
MSGGIPFLDILIFAIIAIFLGLRLRSVLGRRDGFEQNIPRDPEALEAMAEPRTKARPQDLVSGEGIEAIVNADLSFNDKEFVNGASSAYGMILEAFAQGDMEELKPLLGYEMQSGFAQAIRDRGKAGETLSINLVSLDDVKILSAKLTDGVASITVEFRSQQERVLIAEDGSVIEGTENTAEKFIDHWTFERDISSRDPNWLLVETETLQD